MRPIKRVEIVTDSLEMHEVIEQVNRLGISGYTLTNEVLGKGERGLVILQISFPAMPGITRRPNLTFSHIAAFIARYCCMQRHPIT